MMHKRMWYLFLEPSLVHLAGSLSYLEKRKGAGSSWENDEGMGLDLCCHEITRNLS